MTIKTILVPVDFSDVTARMLSIAKMFAQPFNAEIILLHVVQPEPEFVGFEPGPMTVRTAVAHDFSKERGQLDELKKTVSDSGLAIRAVQIQGVTVDKIIDEISEQKVDMVIIGSHGHGAFYHLLTGSVTAGVLKSSPVPVMVIPSATNG